MLDGLRELVVLHEPALRRPELHSEARLARLSEKLPGLLRVVGIAGELRIPVLQRGDGAGDDLRVVLEELLDDGVPVHRVVQGLAHANIVEGLLLDVDHDEQRARRRTRLDREPRVLLEPRDLLRRNVHDQVRVARLEHEHPRLILADGLHQHAVQIRPAAPVGVVPLHRHVVALHPLDELEGAGPDRMQGQVLSPFLMRGGRDDRARRVGHDEEERPKGLLESHAHRGVVHDLGGLDHRRVETRLEGLLVAEDAVEEVLDGLGVERGAVVELHALSQLEGPRQAVLGHRPRLGQPGLELHLRVEPDEVLMHHPVHLLTGVRLGVLRVEAVGIGTGREGQRSAPHRLLCGGRNGHRQSRRAEQHRAEGKTNHPSHVGLLRCLCG